MYIVKRDKEQVVGGSGRSYGMWGEFVVSLVFRLEWGHGMEDDQAF